MKSFGIHILTVLFFLIFSELCGMKPQSRYRLRSQSGVRVNKLLCLIDQCKFFSDESDELAEHLLVKHLMCITCHEQGVVDCIFQTRRRLILHCKENAHMIFYCSKCFGSNRIEDSSLFITLSETSFERHGQVCRRGSKRVKKEQIKKNDKPSYCFIQGCDRKKNPYANLNDLYTHLANVHTVCPFCPDFPSFNSREELVAHAKVQNHPSFYCNYCHRRLIVGNGRRKEMENHEDRCRLKTQATRNTPAYKETLNPEDILEEDILEDDILIPQVKPEDSKLFDFLDQI